MSALKDFNYRISGKPDRPKLVFLHGLMGFLNNWGAITRRLESDFHILVYDQRGHGKSMKPLTGYHPKDYALDLKQIIDELGWDKINLVGHSMGGRNAIYFSHYYPSNLKSLVIEDIGPEADQKQGAFYKGLLESIPVPFSSRDEMNSFFKTVFVDLYKNSVNLEALVPYLKANLEDQGQGQMDWKFYKPGLIETVEQGRAENAWDLVTAIPVPTLLIRGERSKDLTLGTYQKMLSTNPLITGAEVPDAGHWIHSEKPDEFTELIKHFLGQHN